MVTSMTMHRDQFHRMLTSEVFELPLTNEFWLESMQQHREISDRMVWLIDDTFEMMVMAEYNTARHGVVEAIEIRKDSLKSCIACRLHPGRELTPFQEWAAHAKGQPRLQAPAGFLKPKHHMPLIRRSRALAACSLRGGWAPALLPYIRFVFTWLHADLGCVPWNRGFGPNQRPWFRFPTEIGSVLSIIKKSCWMNFLL